MEKLIEKDAIGFIYSEGLFLLSEDKAHTVAEPQILEPSGLVAEKPMVEVPLAEKPKPVAAPAYIPPAPSAGIPSRAGRLLGGDPLPIEQPKTQPSENEGLSPFDWKGNPAGDIALFAQGMDADSLAFAKTVFSNAMIDVWKRIRYTDQDYPEAGEVLAILEEAGVKYLFVFGGGAPSDWYKPSQSFGLNWVRAHSLKELKETPAAKKQLWSCLQSWFLNK